MNKSDIYNAFIQNTGGLKSLISRILRNPNDIDDVAQEVFIRAYQSEKGREIEQPKAFLYRIAKNLAITEASKSINRLTDYIDEVDITDKEPYTLALEDDVEAQERLGIVCQAIASLSPKCREAVLLKKVYGYSTQQVSEHMNISKTTVETHLYKGMLAVRRLSNERMTQDEENYDYPYLESTYSVK